MTAISPAAHEKADEKAELGFPRARAGREFIAGAALVSETSPPFETMHNVNTHKLLLPLLLCAAAPLARAGTSTFTPIGTIDISATNIGSCGGIRFEAGTDHLWVSGAATGNDIFEIDPTSGAILTQFDPSVIPGFDNGADALALNPNNGNLVAISASGEDEAGIVSQAGALVTDFASGHEAFGADFTPFLNTTLFAVRNATATGSPTILRLSNTTGALLESIPIVGFTSTRAGDCAFDPVTKELFVLLETGLLLQVDRNTGAIADTFDLASFLPSVSVAAGMSFDDTGLRLYISSGSGNEADVIHVFERNFASGFCFGDGLEGACPCNNNVFGKHGCENSFFTGGGLLSATGVPSEFNDTFQLQARFLPPSTTCLFFQGTSATTPVQFGDGLRCVFGNIVRLGTKTTSAGAAVFPDVGDPSISAVGLIPQGGGARKYQCWYRNNASFCTPAPFNLTNALRVDWLL
jgi:hypothetical protein